MPPFSMHQATFDDLEDAVGILNARYAWMVDSGIDGQWEGMRQFVRVMSGKIDAGETWLLFDKQIPIGTCSVSTEPGTSGWPVENGGPESAQAMYVSWLAVHQFVSGQHLGVYMMGWAAGYAHETWDVDVMRWSVPRDSRKLRKYSAKIGTLARTAAPLDGMPVALFEVSTASGNLEELRRRFGAR